jgi:UDP-sulfoquinovose synthase
MQCVELAAAKPANRGELRILNQFTETFSVNELAERVQRVGQGLGYAVEIKAVDNPRKEKEEHYYNPAHSGLLELGLQPTYMSDEILAAMMEKVIRYQGNIDTNKILPRVRWK